MPIYDLTARVTQMVQGYWRTHDPALLLGTRADEDAAALWRATQAVDLDTASAELDVRYSEANLALGRLHHLRYLDQSRLGDLAKALLCFEAVSDDASLVPPELKPLVGRFTKPEDQATMALTLFHAMGPGQEPALLDAGILLLAPAATALPIRDARRHVRQSNLCFAYRLRYERDRTAADLELAIAAGEEAVCETDYHVVAPRANLAHAYWCRHRLRGDADDLRRVTDLQETVLDVAGPSEIVLSELATAYRQLYNTAGDTADLTRALDFAERGIEAADGPPSPALLDELSRSLLLRYEQSGANDDLWRAADLAEQALTILPDNDPNHSAHLAMVASILLRRYERSQQQVDVDRAVALNEQALSALSDDDPLRPQILGSLATALHQRYLNGGDNRVLDRAATLGGWALAGISADHPDHRRAAMTLAAIHLSQYTDTGVLDDLLRAIGLGEQVLVSTSARPPEWLSTLSDAYQARYSVTSNRDDLDSAISLGETAVDVTSPTDVALPSRLITLATAYRRRHGHTFSESDIDRAIELGEQAVATTPDGVIQLPGRLAGLAATRLARSEFSGNPADIDAAIDLGERALSRVPAGHPSRSRLTATLCSAHSERLGQRGAAPDPARLREWVQIAEQTQASSVDKVSVHHSIGVLAHAMGRIQLATTMLDKAVELLPSVAPRQAGWADQQYRLGEHSGLVEDGVAAHCAAGDPAGALQVAELGRGVLLATQANTHTDLAELESRDELLAGKFHWVCERLGKPDFPAAERERWWATYDKLLTEIRALPGLEHFLAMPQLDDLRPAAGGFVVLVNSSRQRSDAIILGSDAQPVPIELPNLRFQDVEYNVTQLLKAFDYRPPANDPEATKTANAERSSRVRQTLSWLWDTAVGPVLNTLSSQSSSRHRVWWLPTGLLGLLPLHAAGHPRQPGALDAAVSSYIPSLRALRTARNRPPADRRQGLTVAMRHTPDQPELTGAEYEAAIISYTKTVKEQLLNEQATTGRVLSALTDVTWAHFACHAVVDPASPAQGGLVLHDRTLHLSEVGGLRLDGAEVAYLSACSTANHSTRSADEVLHLASAFQLAGFRHVVASLWPLIDKVAVQAAQGFYSELSDGPTADDAADVLHKVTTQLRAQYPDTPDWWAPLIHSGP
jgi:tetratricopeptide (TPR) repeat protein